MPDNQKKIIPIDYTQREFESIKRDLEGVAKRYYRDSFRDFSEASFGSMLLDAVVFACNEPLPTATFPPPVVFEVKEMSDGGLFSPVSE